MKKAATFAFQVIVTTIIFSACMYVWQLIDHGIKGFDWSILVQGLLFSILYLPFSSWWNKKRAK